VVTFDCGDGMPCTQTLTATLGCGTGTNCRKDVTINVVAPTVYQIGFANDHTLYKTPSEWGGWADGTTLIIDPVYIDDTNDANDKNDPVCVTKNSSTVSLNGVKLKVPQALTYSTTIRVDSNGTYNWNESADVSFSGTTSGTATLGIKGNIINQVKKYGGDFQIQWKYKVPSGTNTWYNIGTTSHTVYVTYGTPDPGGTDLTEKRINWDCTAADGENTAKGVADCIHSALNANPPIDGHDPTQTDDWALLSGTPYQGECDEQAEFMVKALKLLGSTGSAYLTYASTDSSVTSYESKVQDGKTWWLKFDFDNNGSVDNNFEGSVSSAGHYYAVWPSLDASSECLLLRQIGPDNLGVAQRWVRTYGDTFYGATLEHLPGTEPYPTCP
jgi:hypothetical protein